MGNNQSEISDDEDRPTYEYHKKVLQEAESDASFTLASPSHEEERYFTGDEGDSVKSVTPPRNRPESSSGEEFSDSEAAENDEGSDSSGEGVSGVKKINPDLNTSVVKNLRSKKSCGQCNVSTFQEHDSIGPELETARRSGRKSKKLLQTQNTSASTVIDSAVSPNQTSPFKPISSESKHSTSCDYSHIGDSPGSRSVSQKATALCVSQKATALCVSKGKRLGYFDSSDSEENEKLEKLVNVKKRNSKNAQKKSKTSLSSSKSETNDSNNKLQQQQTVQISDSSESEQSESERTTRYRNRISPIRDQLQRNTRSGKHAEQHIVAEMNTNSCATGKPPLIDATNENNDLDEMDSKTYYSVQSLPQQGELFMSTKMGNRCIRNHLGKIVPAGQCVQPSAVNANSKETAEVSRQCIVSEPSNQKTLNSVINSCNSAFVLTEPGGMKQVFASEHQETVDMIKTSTPNTAQRCKDGKEPPSSPFKNVVLTPTKRTFNNNSSWPVGGSNTSGSNSFDEIPMNCDDVMEVDDKNNSSISFPGYQSHNSNSTSTAEHFKRFWSEKKRNISSNLKSFFSKSSSPSSSQNLSGRSQNSFFSASSTGPVRFQGATPVLKSPQNTITTYLSSDRKNRSFVNSSPQQGRLQYPSRGAAVASSHQNASFSLQQVSPIIAPRNHQNTAEHFSNQSLQNSRHQSESGRVSQVSRTDISSSFHNSKHDFQENVTIDILPNSSPNEVLSFQLANFITVSLKVCDLSEQCTAGIVNWTDGGLTHTVTNCSQRIAAKAGALMRAACNDYIENKGSELEAPDVLTTPAGGQFDRSVDALLHVVAPHWRDGSEINNKQALLEVYANCLRFADERLGLESISFPVIGEDIFPVDLCIQAFFDSLLVFIGEHSLSSPPRLTSIQLVTPIAAIAQFAADFILPRLNENRQSSGGLAPEPHSLSTDLSQGASCNKARASPGSSDRDRAPSGRLLVKRPRL